MALVGSAEPDINATPLAGQPGDIEERQARAMRMANLGRRFAGRCLGEGVGADGVLVVNLFAYRATDPKALRLAVMRPDRRGPWRVRCRTGG